MVLEVITGSFPSQVPAVMSKRLQRQLQHNTLRVTSELGPAKLKLVYQKWPIITWTMDMWSTCNPIILSSTTKQFPGATPSTCQVHNSKFQHVKVLNFNLWRQPQGCTTWPSICDEQDQTCCDKLVSLSRCSPSTSLALYNFQLHVYLTASATHYLSEGSLMQPHLLPNRQMHTPLQLFYRSMDQASSCLHHHLPLTWPNETRYAVRWEDEAHVILDKHLACNFL